MRTLATRARALIVILLIGSAVLFVIGTTLEGNESESDEPAVEATGSQITEGEEAESGEEATTEAGELHTTHRSSAAPSQAHPPADHERRESSS